MKKQNFIFLFNVIFFINIISVNFVSCVSDDFHFFTETDSQSLNQFQNQNQNFTIITQEEILRPELLEEQNSFSSTIILKTDEPKANVYLNNIYQGKTPLKIENIQPGFYTLQIDFSSAQNFQNPQNDSNEKNLEENNISKKIIKNFLIEISSNKIQHYRIY